MASLISSNVGTVLFKLVSASWNVVGRLRLVREERSGMSIWGAEMSSKGLIALIPLMAVWKAELAPLIALWMVSAMPSAMFSTNSLTCTEGNT